MEAQPLPVIPEGCYRGSRGWNELYPTGLPPWCICLKGGFDSEALPVGLDPRLRGDDEKEGLYPCPVCRRGVFA